MPHGSGSVLEMVGRKKMKYDHFIPDDHETRTIKLVNCGAQQGQKKIDMIFGMQQQQQQQK